MTAKPPRSKPADAVSGRRRYSPPKLVIFGDVRVLTRTGAASRNEGSPTNKKTTSDARLKQDVIPMGLHSTGLTLYLFRYRPEFRVALGSETFLGVMADEVEQLMPAAVSTDDQGYRFVDYAMLDAADVGAAGR